MRCACLFVWMIMLVSPSASHHVVTRKRDAKWHTSWEHTNILAWYLLRKMMMMRTIMRRVSFFFIVILILSLVLLFVLQCAVVSQDFLIFFNLFFMFPLPPPPICTHSLVAVTFLLILSHACPGNVCYSQVSRTLRWSRTRLMSWMRWLVTCIFTNRLHF